MVFNDWFFKQLANNSNSIYQSQICSEAASKFDIDSYIIEIWIKKLKESGRIKINKISGRWIIQTA